MDQKRLVTSYPVRERRDNRRAYRHFFGDSRFESPTFGSQVRRLKSVIAETITRCKTFLL